jgi:hypothetical protein
MLERLVRSYSFFTVDSNILVLIVAAAMAVNPVRTSVVWRVLHLTALVSIIITGVVFSFVIAEGLQLTPAAELVTICFHYVVPWLFVLGWLLFGPRPQWSPRLLPLVFVWPAGWLGYTFVRGAITGWYPYPFLDARELGLAVAVRNAAIVTVVAVAVASILLLVDRFLPSIGYRRREQAL